MPKLHLQAFCLPKAGNRREEYEDAWACDAETGRLAVADGASDAFESRLWAAALVQAFVREPPPSDIEAMLGWLAAPAQVWRAGIRWDQLPWYAAEKARRGAFATLLGLTFTWPSADSADASVHSHRSIPSTGSGQALSGTPRSLRGEAEGCDLTLDDCSATPEQMPVCGWQAVAVGDACLFQVRDDALLSSFPVTEAAAFGTTPPLLSTRADYSRRSLEHLSMAAGECRPDDLFLLATDALAAWFLREIEVGGCPWRSLEELSLLRFGRLVRRLRHEHSLRNDDVTLLLARVSGSQDPSGFRNPKGLIHP
jgi:hypothetical protein